MDGLAVEVVQHLLGEVGLGESEDDLGIGLGTSLGFWKQRDVTILTR